MKTVILCVLLLTACRDERPPAPTEKESAQLNEMDNALNAIANNEEGPEQRPGPSNSSD